MKTETVERTQGKRIAIMLHYSWMSTQIYRLLLSLIIIEMADQSRRVCRTLRACVARLEHPLWLTATAYLVATPSLPVSGLDTYS